MTPKLLISAKQPFLHFFLVMIFLLIILIDQIIKNAVFADPNRYNFRVFGDFFKIKTFFNYNLSFLNFIYLPVIIYILTTFFIFLVFYKYIYLPLRTKKEVNFFLLNLGTAFIVSGAISNLSDRVRFGFVIDYFFIGWATSAVFNIADIAILLGSILLIREIIKTKF